MVLEAVDDYCLDPLLHGGYRMASSNPVIQFELAGCLLWGRTFRHFYLVNVKHSV